MIKFWLTFILAGLSFNGGSVHAEGSAMCMSMLQSVLAHQDAVAPEFDLRLSRLTEALNISSSRYQNYLARIASADVVKGQALNTNILIPNFGSTLFVEPMSLASLQTRLASLLKGQSDELGSITFHKHGSSSIVQYLEYFIARNGEFQQGGNDSRVSQVNHQASLIGAMQRVYRRPVAHLNINEPFTPKMLAVLFASSIAQSADVQTKIKNILTRIKREEAVDVLVDQFLFIDPVENRPNLIAKIAFVKSRR